MTIPRAAGKIKRLFYEPCLPRPLIWAEALVPATLKAIVSLEPGGWKETIKLASGKSWLKHLKNYIGDASIIEPTASEAGLRFLFECAEIADKSTWYLFLASIGIEFFADWTSLAWQMQGCQHDPNHSATTGDSPFAFASTPGIWFQGPVWNETYPNAGASLSSSVTVPAIGTATICANWTATHVDGTPAPFAMRIWDVLNQVTVAQNELSTADASNGDALFLTAPIKENPFFDNQYWLEWMRTDTLGYSYIQAVKGTICISKGGASGWM